jgi:Fe-S cluster assembly iron-binding protein IscA
MITKTPNAISAVEKFIKGAVAQVVGLRIAISGGGCFGFRNGMSLEETGNFTPVQDVTNCTGAGGGFSLCPQWLTVFKV